MTMPQSGGPGRPQESGAPGAGVPQDSPQYGSPQYGDQQYGDQQYGSAAPGGGMPGARHASPARGMAASPVTEDETRVTGRRVLQYIVDAIIVGIIAGILAFALNRGGAGLRALYIVLDVLWAFAYWALLPHLRNGQTLGMQLMDIRVISKDGGPASLGQFVIRAILLIIFTPLSLLVGIITMMFSRYRQRVGDHLAKTLVVRASVHPLLTGQEFAGAGEAGAR